LNSRFENLYSQYCYKNNININNITVNTIPVPAVISGIAKEERSLVSEHVTFG